MSETDKDKARAVTVHMEGYYFRVYFHPRSDDGYHESNSLVEPADLAYVVRSYLEKGELP